MAKIGFVACGPRDKFTPRPDEVDFAYFKPNHPPIEANPDNPRPTGQGTFYPFAITLGNLLKLFHRIRQLKVAYSLSSTRPMAPSGSREYKIGSPHQDEKINAFGETTFDLYDNFSTDPLRAIIFNLGVGNGAPTGVIPPYYKKNGSDIYPFFYLDIEILSPPGESGGSTGVSSLQYIADPNNPESGQSDIPSGVNCKFLGQNIIMYQGQSIYRVNGTIEITPDKYWTYAGDDGITKFNEDTGVQETFD